MMTERELLELAAKAEGRTLKYMTQHIKGREPEEFIACWNPLTDDGDALRLAVKLRLLGNVEMTEEFIRAAYQDDQLSWTRRAIVCAAAEIGRAI